MRSLLGRVESHRSGLNARCRESPITDLLSPLSFYEWDFIYKMCSTCSMPRWIHEIIPMDIVNIPSGVLHHNIAAILHDVEITHADNLFTVSTFLY